MSRVFCTQAEKTITQNIAITDYAKDSGPRATDDYAKDSNNLVIDDYAKDSGPREV